MQTCGENLASRLRQGGVVHSAWSNFGVPVVCEAFVRAGFSSVVVDMQHGMARGSEARDCVSAIVAAKASAAVRVCVGSFQDASWMLDVGAEAVIAPMVNSAEDAKRLVEFCKYPPVGARSFGAFRGCMLNDCDMASYQETANEETVAMAMIETPEAVGALDDILAVDGLDGVFVGPADLSLTLSNGGEVAPEADHALSMQKEIAEKAEAARKFAGIYCVSERHFHASVASGYRFLAYGADGQIFGEAARHVSSLLSSHPTKGSSDIY
ncbi:aldolase/citrate lyase family protein [Pseudovibrio exalbescens]|uniref:HpcH/HpaI aldolase family protein n=1 Tax=Pseudovibrio exalbescens TaxID=197461 RepID=UPI002365BF7A|nr:aldolase/citrate lyase family protein [Pseudovibrio exalbescens]MDD7910484.1 aldolase/citrate lyase family protein [Pseudovibrio exalbescens]